jgi:hypothetical protein
VRMAPEACDHVSVSAGLVCGELEHAAMLLWSLFDKFLCETYRSFQIRELLGMPERQEEEGFLPGVIEGCIVTVLDPFERKGESLRILRECLSSSAMDRA